MPIAKPFGAMWLLVLFAGVIRSQESPQASVQYGAFALPNPTGGMLLAPSALMEPAMFHTALCSGGARFAVQFERSQAGRGGDRATPDNFDALAGNVFAVLDGPMETSATCFLASDSLMSSAIVLPAERSNLSSECGATARRRLASARSRQIVSCWALAGLPLERRLVLVEFARRDKDALASIALVDHDRVIFADYAAVFRGPGEDVWRVEDGGTLSAEAFEIVFVLQRGSSYALGVNWSGVEGASLAFFVSNGDRFTQVTKDYRYRAPI